MEGRLKRIIIGQLAFLLFLGACNIPSFLRPQKEQKVENQTPEEMQKIGGDKDEHGCFISAGFSWSPTRKECLRIWEAGVRLKDLINVESPVSIIIIENGANGPLEVYLPQKAAPVIMEKDGDDWLDKNEDFLVKKENGKFKIFDKNDKLIAQN